MKPFVYLISFLLLIYTIYIIYFKLKYKFWSKQPVFHFHNLLYWINPPGLITDKFEYSRYYKPKDVIFKKYSESSSLEKQKFHNFISKNYLRIKNNVEYIPSYEITNSYFQGHEYPSYIAYINKNKFLLDNHMKINNILEYQSILTSRPLEIKLNNVNIVLNYVDYLCTKKDVRKKGLAPNLIYTFAINSSNQKTKNGEKINIYMFKRESSSTAIIPLTIFNTYIYDCKNIDNPQLLEPYKITKINNDNINLVYDYLFSSINNTISLKNKFKIFSVSSVNNIKSLLDSNALYIYILHIDDIVYGIYIFRNSEVIYNNKKAIDLIASCNYHIDKYTENHDTKELINNTFINGFRYIMQDLVKENYQMLSIENISHNYYISNSINKKYIISKNVSSYYLYNYAMRPEFSRDCFMVF